MDTISNENLFFAALVVMFDGVDAQLLILSLSMIAGGWGIRRDAIAAVLDSSLIAMAAGTAVDGLLGDRFGRKWALIGSTALIAAMAMLSALANDVWFLGACRAAASLGKGAAMLNVAAMVAEYTPVRSLALAIGMSALPFSGIVLDALGAHILPSLGWRNFCLIAVSDPVLLALLLIPYLPESLSFLVDPRFRLEMSLDHPTRGAPMASANHQQLEESVPL